MTKEQAEFLEGIGDIELIPDYSGRGMYGGTTYAVVTDQYDSLETIIGEWLSQACEYDITQVNMLGNILTNVRTDSMGLGKVYY